MTDITPNLALPEIAAAQAQKHVTHNEALRVLDAILHLAVLDRDLGSPPDTPAEGQRWLVGSPAGGGWAGHVDEIAAWQDGGWQFYPPHAGWLAYVIDEAMLVAWTGSAWEAALDLLGGAAELQNMALLGLGTTADSTNPFSAKLNNALWVARTTAEGGDGDLRYKLSKESAANTLSLLFQDGYAGCAEIGLTGDDDFHFKVSPDGTTWHDGIVIDKDTGAVSFPNTASVFSGGGRELLATDRTYYVRTDGDDGNDGLSDTAGGAFATIQRAVDVVAATLDIGGRTVIIQIGDGTYTDAVSLKNVTGFAAPGNLVIKGNHATPDNVLISTSTHAFDADSLFSVWDIKDLKIVTSSGHAIRAFNRSVVRFGNLDIGAVGAFQLNMQNGGMIVALGDYAISGGGQGFIGQSGVGSAFVGNAKTITFSNSPSYSIAFVSINIGQGYARIDGNTFANGGTVTGKRYDVNSNGLIFTNGAGASYLPGDVAGTAASGGQYT